MSLEVCPVCGQWRSSKSYKAHVRACQISAELLRSGMPPMARCGLCGRRAMDHDRDQTCDGPVPF